MYTTKVSKFLTLSCSVFILINTSHAQYVKDESGNYYDVTGKKNEILSSLENDVRPVQTAVPFLSIAPNARAAALGDQGVATSADENSAYWNPGKLARIEKDYGFGISINPWLKALVGDMYHAYLTGYYRLRKEDVIGLNMTYFDLGSIQFTDNQGQDIIKYNPREVALSATYSRLLSKKLSGGISLKYINSNLSGDISNSANSQASPGQTGAADIGFYYNTDLFALDKDMHLTVGMMIANIGGKISYGNNSRADFIPTTIRLGVVHSTELDEYNKINIGIEASKLMVPSPQVQYIYKPGTDTIVSGYLVTPSKTLMSGMFGSFGDAQFGAKEELQEIALSFSGEYWYDNMFAIRGGYFYENPIKGNRKYFSIGLGIKYKTVGLDLAYLVPTERNHPLANTVRFSLNFNFEKPKDKEQESVVE